MLRLQDPAQKRGMSNHEGKTEKKKPEKTYMIIIAAHGCWIFLLGYWIFNRLQFTGCIAGNSRPG